jgi:hypothetical protein
MTDKFEHLTPRQLAYMMALQGMLASNAQLAHSQYATADAVIQVVDALFYKIAQKEKADGKA